MVELIVLLSLWLIFLSLLFYAPTDTLRLLFLSILAASLFFPLVFVSIFVWIFKDGIGPDAGYSEGWHAWFLVFQDIWPLVLVVMIFVAAGYFANRRARKKIEANRESLGSLLGL